MKAKNTIIVILFCVGLLFAVPKILEGGFANVIQVTALVFPLFLIFLLAKRSWWPGILLASTLYYSPLAGVVLMDRLRVGMLVSAIMVGFYLLEKSMRKSESRLPKDGIKTAWMVLAIIITIRFIWDRPGSARMSETGGLAEAILYVVGAWVFFSAYWIGIGAEDYKKIRGITVVLAIVAFAFLVIEQTGGGLPFNFGIIYARPMWLLFPCLMVISLGRKRGTIAIPWFEFLVVLSMAFSFTSPHRSRPLFAVASALAIAACYKRSFKTAVLVLLCGAIGIGAIWTRYKGEIPELFVRTMSIVVDVDRSRQGHLGETGWSSNFRYEMTLVGFQNIRRHPFVGRGFNVRLTEILDLLATSRTRTASSGADVLTLANSGGYHNTALALAVSCGLPAAILFLFCVIATVIRFAGFTIHCRDPEAKKMGTLLIGYIIPCAGQMLMNGHGYDLIVLAVVIGMMRGLQKKHEALESSHV